MPRTKRFNRDEVLEKAMHLFWKQGYHATSIQDLVDHLGINRASLYNTFGDKKLLFKASFERYRKQASRYLQNTLLTKDDIRSGFKALFMSAVDEAWTDEDKKGCFVVNASTEMTPSCPDTTESVCDNRKKVVRVFANYITQGQINGQITSDKKPKDIANYLFAFYSGFRIVSTQNVRKAELQRMINLALTVLD